MCQKPYVITGTACRTGAGYGEDRSAIKGYPEAGNQFPEGDREKHPEFDRAGFS